MWELRAKYLCAHHPSFDYHQVLYSLKKKEVFFQYLVKYWQLLKYHHCHQSFVLWKAWEGEHKQEIGLGGMLAAGVGDKEGSLRLALRIRIIQLRWATCLTQLNNIRKVWFSVQWYSPKVCPMWQIAPRRPSHLPQVSCWDCLPLLPPHFGWRQSPYLVQTSLPAS